MIDCEPGLKVLDEFLKGFYREKREKAAMPATPSGLFDPVKVGERARKLMDEASKEGRDLSATEAVSQILKNRHASKVTP